MVATPALRAAVGSLTAVLVEQLRHELTPTPPAPEPEPEPRRVHNGDLTITEDGAAVDNLDIHGRLHVKARGVTGKNTTVRGGKAATANASLVTIDGDAYSLTLEDSEVFAANPSPYMNGIIGRNFTLRRVDIHHVVDQVLITGSNVRVEDCELHDNVHYPAGQDPNHADGTHDDNIQIRAGSNITITGNTMTGSHNAVVMVTQDGAQVTDLTIDGNHMDGGAVPVNFKNRSDRPAPTRVRITNNTVGRGSTHPDKFALVPPAWPANDPLIEGNTYTDGAPALRHKGA